jgi:hypothetical protein
MPIATTTTINRNPTLADVVQRLGKNNETVEIVEALNLTNEMLEDMTWVEANNKFTHTTTIRTGLPSVTWRKLNYGVQPSKSTTATVSDTCGMLEAFATVDKKLVEISGNKESWRMTEEAPFLEAMNQTLQRAALYGDSSKDPEQIMGFAPRFNTLSDKTANHVNIIDAGGTGSDLTSIWLIGWGPTTVHMIYPEGSSAGISKEDLGEEPAYDEKGGEYRVLKTHYSWDCGLTVRDWRYVVRIANISKAALHAVPPDENTGESHNLIDLMIKAVELVPSLSGARFAFYAGRDIRTYLRLQQKNTRNVSLTLNEASGKNVLSFDGIPIRRVDALTFGEKQVK